VSRTSGAVWSKQGWVELCCKEAAACCREQMTLCVYEASWSHSLGLETLAVLSARQHCQDKSTGCGLETLCMWQALCEP
jgi:hypothetical protein